MEQVTWLRTATLDEIPIGIVRLSTVERITYVNRAAREASDNALQIGAHIAELRVDPESREKLEAQIADRFSKESGSSYDISLIGQSDKISNVLNVAAVPEYDAHGQLIGSVAFLRSRKFELAVLGMHEIIAGNSEWRPLLEGVGRQLHKYIEFDSMLVTIVSENRKHLRRLLETDQAPVEAAMSSPFKWWPMPEWVKAMLNEIQLSVMSVDEMFAKSPYKELAAADPATQSWLTQGYRHLLRYPVQQNGVLLAIVSLQKRTDVPFSAAEVELIRHLPIQEAVKIAIALDKKAEADFALDVLRELGTVANDTEELQSQLVTRLAKYYGWEHVALFSVDRDKKVFRLAMQHCMGMRSLKTNYEQPFTEGVLGEVLRTGKAVVIDDLGKRARAHTHVEGLKGSRSDMCLPVPGDRLRWILNIESTQKDAFADEEQQSVELLLSMVGFILDRAASRDLKSAIFDSVADAVVLTSRDGVIQEMNPAAVQMFGLRPGDLRERNLAQFLKPGPAGSGLPVPAEGFGETLVGAKKLGSTPVTVRAENGLERPALASGATLPMELGGKVFVLSDLTFATRLERLENLKAIFAAVAGETRVPLSLAGTFVSDMVKTLRTANRDLPSLQDLAEVAGKALAQLRKADLPLERLVRLSTRPPEQPVPLSVLNVRETVNQLLAELPRHEANAVGVSQLPRDAFVKIGVSEFGFCFQSILAFLLRRKSQNEHLQIDIEPHSGRTLVSIQLARDDGNMLESTTIPDDVRDLKQFSFPQDFIAELMDRMGCEYRPPRADDPRFVMALPSA
jgi:PAS domain S-box-containing protein